MFRLPNPDEYVDQIRYQASDIAHRIESLAKEISQDYNHLILLINQKHALIFVADLIRHMKIQTDVDFLSIGKVQIQNDESPILFLRDDLTVNLQNKDVLICTDIVRSGFTMHFLMQKLKNSNPKSLSICSLLHNPKQQLLPLPLKYVGFETDYDSLCGYGMAYQGQGREFPDIIQLMEE